MTVMYVVRKGTGPRVSLYTASWTKATGKLVSPNALNVQWTSKPATQEAQNAGVSRVHLAKMDGRVLGSIGEVPLDVEEITQQVEGEKTSA